MGKRLPASVFDWRKFPRDAKGMERRFRELEEERRLIGKILRRETVEKLAEFLGDCV